MLLLRLIIHPSVASRGGSTFGLGSNSSSSSNNNKRKNTITLGADLSDTIIFEGDELQGKKAPGEKVGIMYHLGGGGEGGAFK